MLETVTFCPFGAECKSIKDNKIHVCKFLVTVAGSNPNTGEEMNKEECSIALFPILLIENTQQQRITANSINQFHHSMSEGNERLLGHIEQTRS